MDTPAQTLPPPSVDAKIVEAEEREQCGIKILVANCTGKNGHCGHQIAIDAGGEAEGKIICQCGQRLHFKRKS
jgi:hypothetical protein